LGNNKNEIEIHIEPKAPVPSLSGTLAKPTESKFKPNFAKEASSPFPPGLKQGLK
jgi:hypothetical protein